MTDKKHIHYDKILEWAADTNWPIQKKEKGLWVDDNEYAWNVLTEYRRKPRWFDMQQEWIAKGKPPVEYLCKIGHFLGQWVECTKDNPAGWFDYYEYRFKEVSRHAALKAEWEAKGRPALQYRWVLMPEVAWADMILGKCSWLEDCDYRIKPTPHPDADVLRALAEDKNIIIDFLWGTGWQAFDLSNTRLRIKPQEETK